MNDDVAIQVEHVSKDFVLPHEKSNSVKSAFTNILRPKDKSVEVQHALKDISFEIKKGEFFGIVGRNGSGKSTMLKILAGIYQPTEGSIKVSGKLVPFIELGVGFNPELTGRENVYLNGAMLGFSRKEVDAMYDEIVEFAELERFMDQKLKNYSSGMQVRLAFSMATRAEADVLLVDEVLAVGDADFQRKCFDYFRQLKRKKKTVVFVSHDMNAIREYCDRAVLIEQSELIEQGSSSKVATAYSRMFIEESGDNSSTSTKKKKKASNRWGDKDIVFEDAHLEKTKITDSDTDIVLKMSIKANKYVEDVVIGFSIKDPADRPLLGTNNQILRQNIKHLDEGQTLNIKWSIPNVFSEGTYRMTIALEGNSRVCDWWEDAFLFTTYLEGNTPYMISPKIKLEGLK